MMDDCNVCKIEPDCFYPYKPCDCVHQRKFWDKERRAEHDEKEIESNPHHIDVELYKAGML